MQIIDKNLFMLELEWFWALKKAGGCLNERIISLADGRRTKEMAVNFLTNIFRDFSLDVTEEDRARFGKLFFNPENINYYSIKEFIIREINFILFCTVNETNYLKDLSFSKDQEMNAKIISTYNKINFELFIIYRKLERQERTKEDLSIEIDNIILDIIKNIESLKSENIYNVNEFILFSLSCLLDDTINILKFNDTYRDLNILIKKIFNQLKDTILKDTEEELRENNITIIGSKYFNDDTGDEISHH